MFLSMTLIESHRSVETPEGVTLDLVPAGPVARGFAWAIDLGVRIVVYILLAMVLGFLGHMGLGVVMVAGFLLEWLYPVIFEVFWKGQTLGKRAMGLRVLMGDGRPVTWSASMLRSIGMAADMLPFPYLNGLLAMTLDPDFRRLGDLMAGTVVVHVDSAGIRMRDGRRDAAPQPPPLPLTLAEQRAIAAFADRLPSFTPERAAELAGHLEPLTGLKGEAAVARLAAYAASLGGRR